MTEVSVSDIAAAEPLATTTAAVSMENKSRVPVLAEPISTSLQIPSSHRTVLTTVHAWPSLEPLSFQRYPCALLNEGMRKDLLHRAIIYEGDNTRQGTAHTRHRTQMNYSMHKIRPQKGTGMARLKDRANPMLRGGGVAHGPNARKNFRTGLQRKVYDYAWRCALSHKYARGDIIVVDGEICAPAKVKGKDTATRWLNNVFSEQGWGKGAGTSLFLTREKLATDTFARIMMDLEQARRADSRRDVDWPVEWAVWRDTHEVDVKNILEAGRIIIERDALWDIWQERKPDEKQRSTPLPLEL